MLVFLRSNKSNGASLYFRFPNTWVTARSMSFSCSSAFLSIASSTRWNKRSVVSVCAARTAHGTIPGSFVASSSSVESFHISTTRQVAFSEDQHRALSKLNLLGRQGPPGENLALVGQAQNRVAVMLNEP